MDFLNDLYSFLAGPCLYLTLPLCIAGMTRKALVIHSGWNSGMIFPVYSVNMFESRGAFLFLISLIYHAAIIIAPLTSSAHRILFDMSWGIMLPAAPSGVTSLLTVAALTAGSVLILRRTFVRHVFAVSSWRDYLLMLIVLAPFMTGYIARTGAIMYELIIVIHCITAHILIVSVGWTRLGHFILFGASKYYSIVSRREAGV